jgi:hypothetical protein
MWPRVAIFTFTKSHLLQETLKPTQATFSHNSQGNIICIVENPHITGFKCYKITGDISPTDIFEYFIISNQKGQ